MTLPHETLTRELRVRGRNFKFLAPRDLEAFVDPEDPMQGFPLWTKIWDAAIVLAEHLASLPPRPEARLLEIGAGLGVSGIVAAGFGHQLTLTERDPNALDFLRTNARLNGCPDLEIFALDWNHPRLAERFDLIVGSEVVYREEDCEPLLRLFRSLLKPGGGVLLAESIRRTSIDFFRRASAGFRIEARRKTLRSAGKEAAVILGGLRPL